MHASSYGLFEWTVRLPVGFEDAEKFVTSKFLEFNSLYGQGETLILVTVNVILRGKDSVTGKDTYSIFFGQNFGVHDKASEKYCISGPHNIESLEQFKQEVPLCMETDEILEKFTDKKLFMGEEQDSGTSVLDVVNLIYIFRKIARRESVKREKD